MAETQTLRMPSAQKLEMACDTISGVAGSLGVVAMISRRVHDDEMVIDPCEFYGMMETLRGQLAVALRQLRPDI